MSVSITKSAAALAAASVLALSPVPTFAEEDETEVHRTYQFGDTLRVYGERIPTDPITAPVATTDVPASDFRNGRGVSLDETLAGVPGVVAQGRAGSPDVRITIRGFGARGAGDRSNAGTTRGVRILLDGFPITEPDGRTSLDLPDLGMLSHVRVVRSNSSALYGSASGGLIDLVSTDASTPFFDSRAAIGSFGFQRYQTNVGGIQGSARLRASVSHTSNDGWRENSEATQLNGQASAVFDPTQRAEFGVYLWGAHNEFEMPGALTMDELKDDPRQANPGYVDRHERRDNRIGRAAVRLRQRLGDSNFLLATGYVEPKTITRSERNRYRDFQRVHLGGSATYSQELPDMGRMKGRWNLGVEEARQDGSILFYTLGENGSRGDELVADTREGNSNFGVYSELDLRPAERWSVDVGARWDFLKYIAEDHMAENLNSEKTLDHASPRVSLAYSYREGASAYAALSGGIEGPAFNEVDPPAPYDTLQTLNPFLKPARSVTFEVGTKGRIPVGHDGFDQLTYDVALYTLTVNDDIVPWDGGAFYFMAGETRRRGIEIGTTLDTDVGLRAQVSAAFTKNEYIDYVRDDIRFDGNAAAGIPGKVVNGVLRYEAGFGGYVEGRAHFVGEYFADDANSPEAKVPFFTAFDGTVGASRPFLGRKLEVFVTGQNLSDENYVSSVFINGAGGRFFEPGMERNFLFGLSLGGALP